MSKNRMFRGKATERLIIRIERETIEAIDEYLKEGRSWVTGNRSEFVRRAVEEKLRGSTS
jgi:metal-responsive CopG/Arc/MetJ family transcriptional regulator